MIHKYLLVFFLIGIVLVSSYDINRPSRAHSRPSSGQSHHNDHSHESHHPSGPHHDHSHEEHHHDHSHESHHPSGSYHHDHSHEEHHHDHSHESHHPSGSYHHDHSHEEHHHEHSHESHHPSNPHHEQNSDSNSGDQTISIDDPIIEESDMEDFPIIENSEDEEEQYAEDQEPIEEDEQQYDEESIEEDSSVEDEPISSGWSECEECIHFMRFLSRKFSRSINSRSDLLRFCNKNELMKPYCESNLGMIYNYLRTKLTNSHICSKLNICLVNKKNAIVNKIQDLASRLSSKIDKILSLDETASMELKLNNIMDLKNKNIMDLKNKNIMDLKHKNIMDLKHKNIMDLKHKNKDIMDLKNKNIMDLKQKNATQEIMELRQKNSTQDIMELKHKNIMDLKHKNLMDLKPSRHENDIMELYPAKSHSQKSCKGQAPTRFHVCEDGEWVLHYSLSDARLLALSGTGICLVLALFTCLLCALRRRRPCKNASYQPVKTVETI